jgi:hypothetical protein
MVLGLAGCAKRLGRNPKTMRTSRRARGLAEHPISSAMNAPRIDTRRLTMAATVLPSPSASFPTALFVAAPMLFTAPFAHFATHASLNVPVPALFVTPTPLVMDGSAIPGPNTPSNAREQQCQDKHLLKHRGLLLAFESIMRFLRTSFRCYIRHPFGKKTGRADRHGKPRQAPPTQSPPPGRARPQAGRRPGRGRGGDAVAAEGYELSGSAPRSN